MITQFSSSPPLPALFSLLILDEPVVLDLTFDAKVFVPKLFDLFAGLGEPTEPGGDDVFLVASCANEDDV